MVTKNKKTLTGLKQDLNTVANQSKETMKKGVHNLKKGGKTMIEPIEKQAYNMGEKAREVFKEIEGTTKEGLTLLEDNAKAYPFITIGLSVIAGMLLAKLASSSK